MPDAFCNSAMEFALSALDAHRARRFRRVAVDAGTSLEHLAKASLAKRSPALLAELKNEANFSSLLVLLGIKGGKPPKRFRTVGLRDGLTRAQSATPAPQPGHESCQAIIHSETWGPQPCAACLTY